jgi:hypothetical protein
MGRFHGCDEDVRAAARNELTAEELDAVDDLVRVAERVAGNGWPCGQ